MATYYGIETSKPRSSIPQARDQGTLGGGVKTLYDKYTLSADLSAADVIVMGKLPAGARVVGYWLKSSDLDASGGTLDLGWAASSDAVVSADDDGFLSNVDVATAAITVDHADQDAMVGLGKKFDSAVDVQVKVEGDTDATSGDIEVCIFYVVD